MEREKFAWRATLIDGMKEEYILRHDNISENMKEVLSQAGICNYSIWVNGNELFGYYECEKGVAFAQSVQAKSTVVADWNEYMKDVILMQLDRKTGAQPKMEKVFSFR